MEWFYCPKLHFVINHKSQVMTLRITPGNTADSTVLDQITQPLAGKLYADKDYIGHALFKAFWQRGLHLITGIRRNMRNDLMPSTDKALRHRGAGHDMVFRGTAAQSLPRGHWEQAVESPRSGAPTCELQVLNGVPRR
jgi:hypothetical protein